MDPAISERNLMPTSTAEVSDSSGVPGTVLLKIFEITAVLVVNPAGLAGGAGDVLEFPDASADITR